MHVLLFVCLHTCRGISNCESMCVHGYTYVCISMSFEVAISMDESSGLVSISSSLYCMGKEVYMHGALSLELSDRILEVFCTMNTSKVT